MMYLNNEGKMEFPRDLMVEDCFGGIQEPLYGFVSNVTLSKDRPCIENEECFLNGTVTLFFDSKQTIPIDTNATTADDSSNSNVTINKRRLDFNSVSDWSAWSDWSDWRPVNLFAVDSTADDIKIKDLEKLLEKE